MNGSPPAGANAPIPHRPLARWVARLDTAGSEPGVHHVTGLVNDGAERTDARALPRFQDPAWRRTGVTARRGDGPPVPALALHHPVRGILYVELDHYGRPLPASPAGAELVTRIETHWDAPPAEPSVLRVLGEESPNLRHVLLHRLADETDPPASLFHTLPWADLDTVAGNVLTMLDGSGPVERPGRELLHWFTPAAIRLAGPLAVLERGMREGRDPALLRHEAVSLLTGLLAARPERIPDTTAERLVRLADRLSTRDPLLRHTARVVAARLRTGRPDRRSPSLTLRLDPLLPAAARTTGASYRRTARDELFEVKAEHTPGGRIRVTLTLPHPVETAQDTWTTAPDGLVTPLSVRTAEPGAGRFWIALRSRATSLQGALELFAPAGRLDLVADEPAVPFAGLRAVPAPELLPSLRASSAATQRLWERAAAALPPDHPVPAALRLYQQDVTH
ncbi:hypothetical protein [Streptomyces sp. NPDC088755]|uniref:hypothetical protein n=1 Tax=Streptomyces sp. NPDC088755 TaxID=3365888 RepID=UPI0037F8D947